MTLKPFFQQRIQQEELRRKAQNMTRQEMFDHGFLTVKDLDDEELRYGKCRDRNGRIPKPPNKTEMVPLDLYDEMVAEHQKRTTEKLRQQMDIALDVMVGVMTDDTVEPKDRFAAAQYLFERVAGKTIERVAVTVQKAPWEEMFAGIAQVTRAQSEAQLGAVDAEVVALPDEPETGPPDVRVQPPEHSPIIDVHESVGGRGGRTPDGVDDAGTVCQLPIVPEEFTPHEAVPSHDEPVNSMSVADQLRAGQEAAADLAIRRKAAKDRIQAAKKSRIIKRAMGQDAKVHNDIEATVDGERIQFTLG